MRRALLALGGLLLSCFALDAVGCSQTPVVVPLRSMERPKDMDFVCLWHVDTPYGSTWRGVPLNRCHVDINATPAALDENGDPDPNATTHEYRLHAVVTQLARGELAVVDLGTNPNDPGQSILKLDPRLPGYTFLPVGAVPNDVVTDPQGKAIYVASGHDRRVDVIPAEMLRGPIDTTVEQFGVALPWPHIDLADDEGEPTRLATYDDGTNDRLYVVLPDAAGGPKIAVFDIGCPTTSNLGELCDAALLPRRVGDIELTLSSSTPLAPTTLTCNTTDGSPWWIGYEKACFPANLSTPTVRQPELLPPIQMHIGAVTVTNGLLFAADDGAPYIHVFDISGGRGAEIQRIDVGSKISRLSVSPPVPDEVTFQNANAIQVCEANDWLGDRQPHNESSLVANELGGFCRAHRYIYAVDYDDTRLGSGTIAVVDLPVFLERDETVPYNPTSPNRRRITGESIDFASMSLSQPMGCDSPAFASTRIPLGAFAIGGLDGMPARAVTFVNYDPPSPSGNFYGLRCRSWGSDPVPGDGENAFPSSNGAAFSSGELDVLPGTASKASLQDGENSWTNDDEPRRMRGTFAFVAMASGGIGIVDVDDWDSLCRGPSSQADINVAPLASPMGNVPVDLNTPRATREYTYAAVRRHHPRSLRFFDVNNVPGITSILLTNAVPGLPNTTTLAWGIDVGQRVNPHLVPLLLPTAQAPANPQATDFIKTSADNPFGYTQENWTVTYQGALPSFGGTGASIDVETQTVRDPYGSFCERGVEAFDPSFGHNDVVQIIDDVCEDASTAANLTNARAVCTGGISHAQCLDEFGISDITQGPLDIRRDLVIGQAFDQHVTIAQHYELDKDKQPFLAPGLPQHLKECFPQLVRYTVRARDSWVVNGTTTGYLHRVISDPTAKSADAPCIVDVTKPLIFEGRVREIPAPGKKDAAVNPIHITTAAETCPNPASGYPGLFVNPQWQFAIQTGYDTNGNGIPTGRDYTFSFGGRYDYFPLTVPGASMPVAIRSLQVWKNGQDVLGWNMISLIDAIDKGFALFFVADTTNSKVFE